MHCMLTRINNGHADENRRFNVHSVQSRPVFSHLYRCMRNMSAGISHRQAGEDRCFDLYRVQSRPVLSHLYY